MDFSQPKAKRKPGVEETNPLQATHQQVITIRHNHYVDK
jgi:hypothetical protein